MNTRAQENRNSSDSSAVTVPILQPESELQFKDRLRDAIAKTTLVAFAKQCGFSDSLLGAYLRGDKQPGLEKLVAISRVAGVTLDWLATGRGPKTQAELRALLSAPSPASVAALDLPRLQAAIATVEEGLTATRRVMDPDRKAELVLAVYDLFEEPANTRDLVLRLVKSAA